MVKPLLDNQCTVKSHPAVVRKGIPSPSSQSGRSYLVEDERTLQATFTGPVGQQVGLHLLQAGQQGAAGTAGGKPGGDSSELF